MKKCSFCGRFDNEVKNFFIGNEIIICEYCIIICNEIINKEINIEKENKKNYIPFKPKEIKRELDNYIIGQNKVKKSISVSIYNHYKRISFSSLSINKTLLYKSNIIMVGKTGSGKTLIAKTISKIINVPFIITDATSLTEAGYVGDDVETILQKLLASCDYNLDMAEKGIVYIDEIDKISKKSPGNLSRDVSGEGVQQSLLKIVEGSILNIPLRNYKKFSFNETIQIDTTNILFICGGAFTGISESKKGNFNSLLKKKKIKNFKIGYKDLINYGMIPEFVGRFPLITCFEDLKKEDYSNILIKTKDSIIKQYKIMFLYDGIDITFSKRALKKISDMSFKLSIGARGIRHIMDKYLIDIMYYAPSIKKIRKIIINKNFFKTGKPIISRGV
ncbi:ATP-dependent Clp protease ATP-binding subunit ClpX [Candidatus Vidania fulgoroideorum]